MNNSLKASAPSARVIYGHGANLRPAAMLVIVSENLLYTNIEASAIGMFIRIVAMFKSRFSIYTIHIDTLIIKGYL